MSRLGASQTSSTRPIASASGRPRRGHFCYPLNVFGEAHQDFSQSNSATGLPACCALPSYFVTGRSTEMGRASFAVRGATAVRRHQRRRCARRIPRGPSPRAAHRRAAAGRRSSRPSRAAEADACDGAPWPRIRKEHPHSGQRVRTEHVLEDVDAVAADQADVGHTFTVDAGQQLSQPATVDLDGNHIDLRLGLGHRQRRGARSAADLEHDGSADARTTSRCPVAGQARRCRGRACPPRAKADPRSPAEHRSARCGGFGSWSPGDADATRVGPRHPRYPKASVHGRSSRAEYPHRGTD